MCREMNESKARKVLLIVVEFLKHFFFVCKIEFIFECKITLNFEKTKKLSEKEVTNFSSNLIKQKFYIDGGKCADYKEILMLEGRLETKISLKNLLFDKFN